MGDNLVFSVRGNNGFFLKRGLTSDAVTVFENMETPKDNPCQVFEYSNNGQLFAYCDGKRTRVININSGQEVICSDNKRTKSIVFSPKDTYMLTFVQYAIYGTKTSEDQKPEPNLRIYQVADGKHLQTIISQKEATWKPQWTEDESIAVRLIGSELLVYQGGNIAEKHTYKLTLPGISAFAVSPGPGPNHYICTYIPCKGTEPARVQVRRLVGPDFPMVASKTFFKSDHAELSWNSKGNAVHILSTVDVDSTNLSYYGEQNVYLINVSSDESFRVPLAKTGPVYQVKWNPNGKEFAVCYGYMPAKVTFYNLRGDPIFDTIEGPRNELYYNAFGNILVICGFGNLAQGKMEFWDVEKKTNIINIDVPNTTQFQWAPDGQHFITAITTPRLRIDNCYRLWHYSGRLINEVLYDPPKELWEVKFRPMLGYNKFEVRELTKADKLQAGLLIKKKDASHPLNNVPAGAVKKQTAYVPPHLRKAGAPGAIGAGPATNGAGKSAAPIRPQMNEADKRVFNLRKKIQECEKLKEKQDKGEAMLPNQLDKLSKMDQFVRELAQLSV